MHLEVMDFIGRMRDRHPKLFLSFKRVFEAGSLNVNGSPRKFFGDKGIKYVGLDWRKGPGVDVVSLMHKYRGQNDGTFDLVISTEMLEHDPYWVESIRAMCRLVKKGGCLLITCGGVDRHKHDVATSPVKGYYDNLGMAGLVVAILSSTRFRFMHCEDDPMAKDTRIFCWGKM